MKIEKLDFVTDSYNLFEDVKDGKEVKYARVEMFRTGVFEHRWYGRLNIDKKYLQTMVKNWKNKVYTTQVSFDLNHDHNTGATAWLPFAEDKPDSLTIKKKTYTDSAGKERTCLVLVGIVELTEFGYESLASGQYKYFSAEIDPNFIPYERFYEQDKDGQVKEEVVEEYGPTIKGGGFVNFPYIVGMDPISLSFSSVAESGDEEIPGFSVSGGSKDNRLMIFSSKIEETEVAYSDLDEEKTEKVEEPEDINEYNDTSDRSTPVLPDESANEENITGREFHMNLSTILASLEGKTSKEKISILSASTQSFSSDAPETVVLSALLKTEQALEQKDLAFQAEVTARISADKQIETLKLSNVDLARQAEQNKQLAYGQRVQVFCQDLEKSNHHQSVINKVKEILDGVSATQRDQKFSVTADGKSADLDLFSIFKDVLDTLPETARFSDTETFTATGNGGVQNDTQKPKTEVKKDKLDLFFAANPGVASSIEELRADSRWADQINDKGELIAYNGK